MEPYVQEARVVYGKLSTNSIIIYMPASQTSPPTLVPTFQTPSLPTLVPTLQIASPFIDSILLSTSKIVSGSSTVGLEIDYLDEDLTKLERLAITWEDCHIVYYESMDFKDKLDKREASARTSQVFWYAFEDLCKDILQSSNGSGEVFDACMNLQKRRQLRHGISTSETTLVSPKLSPHLLLTLTVIKTWDWIFILLFQNLKKNETWSWSVI